MADCNPAYVDGPKTGKKKHMTYRLDELKIPEEDTFEHDKLSRKESVQFLSNVITKTNGPYVVALDSPWGTGKTTIVHMLMSELKKSNFQTVYFNAWEVDYMSDPLVAMVAAIDAIKPKNSAVAKKFENGMTVVKNVTTAIAKRALITGVKAATQGIVDLEKIAHAVGEDLKTHGTDDVVAAFKKRKEHAIDFRKSLQDAVNTLKEQDKNTSLVFFIDELDRCRPTFAIELLERVKHIFDVKNIIFVLSVDKKQLEEATKSVYGIGINAPEYLRRFIDLEFTLPPIAGQDFTRSLINRFGLTNWFDARQVNSADDLDHFINYFTTYADIFDLSLRARERCIARLKIVIDQIDSKTEMQPILVAFFIVLRMINETLYNEFIIGRKGSQDLIDFIKSHPKGAAFMRHSNSIYPESQLIQIDKNHARIEVRRNQMTKILEDINADPEEKRRTSQLRDLMNNYFIFSFNINSIAQKIDLASHLNN